MRNCFFIIIVFFSITIFSQYTVSGIVTSDGNKKINNVQVFEKNGTVLTQTNAKGYYQFTTSKSSLHLVFYAENYPVFEKKVAVQADKKVNVVLQSFSEELSEIEIRAIRRKAFALKQLKQVEGTAIYAGKKSEVVLISEMVGNKAVNNARQIYSQVVGLNIYENDDAGLQLNIGGRGLDPNRTANFNTRQNGYDMSADVLGYPESYYTPPSDALQEIQVIRGAASLQYGTQFGGLLNFKFNKPVKNKKFELLARQSIGSFGLFNSFNSVSGTVNKTGYYGYFNYKKGNGFRPNSEFNSINAFINVAHSFNHKTSLEAELTYLKYLAKQAGGLTDAQFNKDMFYSNRSRNWFAVNWKLWAVKFKHDFNENSKFSFNLFGLDAQRKAIGFRGRVDNRGKNPITDDDEVDQIEKSLQPRDLMIGNFKNWGAEARFLSNYTLGKQKSTYLLGAKYYQANNSEQQGAGSVLSDADFSFIVSEKDLGSNFKYPNKNVAFFGENIFKISDQFSVTPGFRIEYIKTIGKGTYVRTLFDGADNPLPNGTFYYTDDRTKERSFALLGIGLSYKYNSFLELYANASQNYRSVTFNDIRTVSPTFIVDENIDDEKGGTADFGFRGKYKRFITFDIGGFMLWYNKRIGVVLASEGKNKGDRMRTNVGDAFIYGAETFTDFNMSNILGFNNDYSLNAFVNFAYTQSEYLNSVHKTVKGKKVEFIPEVNLKTGLKFGYKNWMSSFQFSHLTEQFTDGTNADAKNVGKDREGTIGAIPAYSILDVSLSYKYKKWKLESGVNNALDKHYFTRRATGYPGPGIIPSAPRNWYFTLEFTL